MDSRDHAVIGKIGRITGSVGPKRVGEVMLSVRGGTEAFHAYAMTSDETFDRGDRVVVVEYHPPRTVIVARA